MNLLGTLGGLYRFHRKHEGNKKQVSDWVRHFGPGYIFISLSLSLSCKTKRSTLHCISVHQCMALYVFTVSVSILFHFKHMLMGVKFSPCVHMLDEFGPTSKVFRSCRVRDGNKEPHLMCPRWAPSAHRSICWATIGWVPASTSWHMTCYGIHEYIYIWIYSMKFPSYPIQYRHHHIETQSSYHLAKKCISQNHPIRSHQNKIASLVLRQVFSSNLQAQLRHQNRRRGLFPSVLRRGGSTVKPCHWWKSERTLMGIFHPPKTQHKCYRTNGVEKLRNFWKVCRCGLLQGLS